MPGLSILRVPSKRILHANLCLPPENVNFFLPTEDQPILNGFSSHMFFPLLQLPPTATLTAGGSKTLPVE